MRKLPHKNKSGKVRDLATRSPPEISVDHGGTENWTIGYQTTHVRSSKLDRTPNHNEQDATMPMRNSPYLFCNSIHLQNYHKNKKRQGLSTLPPWKRVPVATLPRCN